MTAPAHHARNVRRFDCWKRRYSVWPMCRWQIVYESHKRMKRRCSCFALKLQ
jgi:hypothetical protein